jgi:hypothetical protein
MLLNGFRLSLTPDPVSTSTGLGSSGEINLVPYHHGFISLWNGIHWQLCKSGSRITIAFATISAQMFGEICDIFAFMNLDGSIGIESGPKWTNSTTRSTQLVTLDGALVKQGDPTRLYVGTVMCWSDFGMLDTEQYRHCWNMYNRVPRTMFYAPDDSLNTTWIYTSNTIQRRAGDSNPNGLWYVSGMPTMFSAEIVVDSTSPPGSGVAVYPGVGIDGSGTTYASGSYSASSFADQYTAGVAMSQLSRTTYTGVQSIGSHRMEWNERIVVTAAGFQMHNNHNLTNSSLRSHMRGIIMA